MLKLDLQNKFNYLVMTALLSSGLIILMAYLLPGRASMVMLGFESREWKFTIQIMMWIAFVAGFLLTLARAAEFQLAKIYLQAGYLPNDDETVLQAPDLHPIFNQVKSLRKNRNAYLPNLIYMAIVQFQSSKSIEQTTSVVNSQLNMLYEDLDLKYAFIRYYIWLLPTMGFIGTVYGISLTVARVGTMATDDPSLLAAVAGSLAIAFDTTLVALIQTAILLLVTTMVQHKEEGAMNSAGQFVLSNLVNRLYREW